MGGWTPGRWVMMGLRWTGRNPHHGGSGEGGAGAVKNEQQKTR